MQVRVKIFTDSESASHFTSNKNKILTFSTNDPPPPQTKSFVELSKFLLYYVKNNSKNNGANHFS